MVPLRAIRSAPFALAAILALSLAAAAADDAEKPAYSALNGSITYRTYCSNCHGAEGRGDGYIAETLNVAPTDLTKLAAANNGVFPEERVREAIDGRKQVRAHGRREMPIWGDIFLWPEKDSPERREHVTRKIGELVEHLRTIQEPTGNP